METRTKIWGEYESLFAVNNDLHFLHCISDFCTVTLPRKNCLYTAFQYGTFLTLIWGKDNDTLL